MRRDPVFYIYVGIKNSVIALDDRTGMEVWRARLRGSDYVNVLWDGEALIASNSGEVWRLDPNNGAIMWHNDLKSFGRGVVSLASGRAASNAHRNDAAAEKRRRDQHAAVAASTAAAAAT